MGAPFRFQRFVPDKLRAAAFAKRAGKKEPAHGPV